MVVDMFNFFKKIEEENEGQALFEFIVFVPFFLVLFVVFITISGAINGSINQLKSTRGYFFYIVKNNSTVPFAEDLKNLESNGIQKIGSYAFGWQRGRQGQVPIAPCYKLTSFIKSEKREEKCEEQMDSGEKKSTFIKVMTAYGVCATTYVYSSSDSYFIQNPLSINDCFVSSSGGI